MSINDSVIRYFISLLQGDFVIWDIHFEWVLLLAPFSGWMGEGEPSSNGFFSRSFQLRREVLSAVRHVSGGI